MSLRRFMGWEPEEVHEQYDADGSYTGRTVVTREPEWDDEQRAIVLSKREYDRRVHHGCGTHVSKSMDPTVARKVDSAVLECLDCKAIDRARDEHHKRNNHTDKKCDCDSRQFFVSEYIPIPE